MKIWWKTVCTKFTAGLEFLRDLFSAALPCNMQMERGFHELNRDECGESKEWVQRIWRKRAQGIGRTNAENLVKRAQGTNKIDAGELEEKSAESCAEKRKYG